MALLSQVTDPSYLEGLEEWPLEAVRSRRDESNEIEIGLSYLRRIVQGRLDIVIATQTRRQRGDQAVDSAHLVEELSSILSDHVHAPGLGRMPTLIGPGALDPELEAELESVLSAATLSSLDEFDDETLTQSANGLAELERTISVKRRAVFDVLDRLQEEIVRRYRTGEATVDTLLR